MLFYFKIGINNAGETIFPLLPQRRGEMTPSGN